MSIEPTGISSESHEAYKNKTHVQGGAYKALREFFKMEASGGLLLILGMILALIAANSAFSDEYHSFLHTHLSFKYGDIGLDKSLGHWINDGLMAIFFFLIGLEIKREVLEGELSTMKQALFPICAAVGGVAVPAGIFAYLNWSDPVAVHGWAIPAATDIAFALGILSLFGKRVPFSLKMFLMAVAVIDDLAAIVIIGIFYTANLSLETLGIAAICAAVLLYLNMRNVNKVSVYVFIGFIMWVAVLKSGIHATLAGVILGMLIPHGVKNANGKSIANKLEHDLHPWVAFVILPIFAFANAGVSFEGISMNDLGHPIVMGIILGLFFGKQIGIMSIGLVMRKLNLITLPKGSTWAQFYAVSILAGIGFTMSLFIGTLAYSDEYLKNYVRLGVLAGSFLSVAWGMIVLQLVLPKIPYADKAVTPEKADV